MISGIVNANDDALVRLFVRGSGSILHEVEAVLDTGFNGFLSLPVSLIDVLGLPYLRRERVMLSNGNIEECAVHEGVLLWDGQERNILIQATDGGPLLGMSLLHGHKLMIFVEDGGNVTIEALP